MFHRLRSMATWLLVTILPAAVAVIWGCNRSAPDHTPSSLDIGYMICNSLEETRGRFEPLSAYLSDVLEIEVRSHYINTFEFEEEMKKGYLDLAHTNSLLYVIFRENYGWNLLAVEKRGKYGSYTAGAIIVPRDSRIATLEDLKGKKLMFGPEMAPMGYLSQYYLMLEGGLDPEMDLGYYAIPRGSFKHEKVVYAVLYEGFDAGAIPVLDLEVMEEEGKIRPEDYRVLARAELVPYCTVSVSPSLDTPLTESLRDALLSLSKDATARVGAEVLKVMDRAFIDGFEILEDSDYDPIRRMARRVNMPPYQEY